MSMIPTFPKPLLQDLVEGRWLPIVGAGFSRNAVTPPGKVMPDWNDLGRSFAEELKDYPYVHPVDAISAYCHEFSRARLIERLEELLLIDEAQPGGAHKALCRMPFDLLCTTNFDFLLEQQYRASQGHCTPLIEETQLSVNTRPSGVSLLKLHGDLHHPKRLVVTESDYASFLDRFPLIATYVSSLLIKRTPVLIGYSLDDPDFQQLWQVIGNRLGASRRDAYALVVSARRHEIAKYARRGVTVVSLGDDRTRYGQTLAKCFNELADYWTREVLSVSEIREEDSRGELALPAGSSTNLCFFAVPSEIQSLYRKYVFPLARRWGFIPITADEVVAPGDNIVAKVDALISRAHIMVVDASSQFTLHELSVAISKRMSRRLLVVLEEDLPRSARLRNLRRVRRPRDLSTWPEEVLQEIDNFFQAMAEKVRPHLLNEPRRLLNRGEHRAAVISAMTLLESTLRKVISEETDATLRSVGLGRLLRKPTAEELIGPERVSQVREWVSIRNAAVHTMTPVNPDIAEQIVNEVEPMVQNIEQIL